jgi:hypothetical protein
MAALQMNSGTAAGKIGEARTWPDSTTLKIMAPLAVVQGELPVYCGHLTGYNSGSISLAKES